MAVEQMRGCGYRKVGGLYLCGGGQSMDCDRFPYELVICPVCGAGVKFTRGWTWLDWMKYAGEHHLDCNCMNIPGWNSHCPVCFPNRKPQPYGLLWVGEASYTPQSFVQEALTIGVSRRIAAVPKNLKLGETWVLFAHKRAAVYLDPTVKYPLPALQEPKPAVFYAFRPQSLELLIWQLEAKPEYLEDLAKRNITPVIIPDDDEDHHPDTKTKMSTDDRADVDMHNKIALLRQTIGG